MKQVQIKHLSLFMLLALLVLTAISYSNSFTCSWHFDDYRCIVDYDYKNATAASLFAFSPGRFIGFLTFWLNYNICGYAVAGWHLVNLLIHLLNVLLVYIIAVRLIRDAAARITNPQKELAVSIIAAVIAALFAIHPIQTQAVTYIVQRLELLGTTWVLLTFLFLLNAIGANKISRNILWGLAAAVTILLGMFTKEFIVVAPLLAGAYYVIVKAQTWKKRGLVSGVAVLCALAGVIGVLYYCRALSFTPYPQVSMAPFARLWNDQPPPAQYYPTQVRVLLLYLRLCLFPFNQHVEYAISPSSSFFDFNVVSAALIQIGIITAACFAWRRRPMILFGLVWFYLFLAPSSSLLPNGMYEHRLYGALFGILVALFIPLGVEIIDQPARFRRALAPIALSLAAFLVVCFCFLTYNRNEVWQTERSLWEDAVKKSPGSWRAQSNYGNQLMEENRYIEAYPYVDRGFLLNSNMASTAVNLGVCRYYVGDIDGSIEVLEYALGLKSDAENMHNLIVEYLSALYIDTAGKHIAQKNYDAALPCVNRVLELQPDNSEAKKLKTTITEKGKDQ